MSDDPSMLLTTPSTWTDALDWLRRHVGHPLAVSLVAGAGGVSIDGPGAYDDLDEDADAFGIVLDGRHWTVLRSNVTAVHIDPLRDVLLLHVGDTKLCLEAREP